MLVVQSHKLVCVLDGLERWRSVSQRVVRDEPFVGLSVRIYQDSYRSKCIVYLLVQQFVSQLSDEGFHIAVLSR